VTHHGFVTRHAPSRVPRRALLFATSLSLLLSGVAAPSANQDTSGQSSSSASAPQSETPRFRAEANFVRVDVYVTEDGVPIRDLKAEDFAVFEDGVPQKIDTFEHVQIQGSVPQETRREPQSASEGRAMAEDPRARVFVVFLDTYHTDVAGSYYMQGAVVKLLDRLIGPSDVFAVMTPQMSARDLAFARRTDTIAGMLRRYWYWGQEGSLVKTDPDEQEYLTCYPPVSSGGFGNRASEDCTDCGVAAEMIDRRRELRTLTALDDLAVTLRGVREERKAVIAITSGWRLFRPNPGLVSGDRPRPIPQIGVDPQGRITTDDPDRVGFASDQQCAADRIMLAEIDNNQYLHEILDRANRGNVSFYPVDAQGLRSWNSDLGSQPIGGPDPYGREALAHRLDTLRLVAGATDGLAVIDTNDFDRGMRRIVEDLSSYYLLGYHSSNGRLDGRFRSIKVKVNRPGVDVRARRGYAAPKREEIERAQQLAWEPTAAAPASAVQSALQALAGIRRDTHLFSHVTWTAAPEGEPARHDRVWVTAELDPATARSSEWAAGGAADIILAARDGETIAAARQPIVPGARTASIAVPNVTLTPGDYTVQLRLAPTSAGVAIGDSVTFSVPESRVALGPPRLHRRGPTTGSEYTPTADRSFRRTERIRVDVPVSGSALRVEAELLDRNGNTMPVPVEATLRPDADGALTWATAEVVLAPLAPGDYVIRTTIEQANRRQEVLAAFRMVP
jgi:VWFA-related protein